MEKGLFEVTQTNNVDNKLVSLKIRHNQSLINIELKHG